MINESFDDDIPDDDEFIVDPGAIPAKPLGDFSRVLSGRTVWFNAPIPGQFHAWKRHRESLANRFQKAGDKARKAPSLELLRELSELSEKLDTDTLELVESLMVSADDIDFVATEMISGRVTMHDIYQVLFGDPGPDDDQAPTPKPVKKAAPKKIGGKPVKKTANATRVKK